jgi:hypothetical protein
MCSHVLGWVLPNRETVRAKTLDNRQLPPPGQDTHWTDAAAEAWWLLRDAAHGRCCCTPECGALDDFCTAEAPRENLICTNNTFYAQMFDNPYSCCTTPVLNAC